MQTTEGLHDALCPECGDGIRVAYDELDAITDLEGTPYAFNPCDPCALADDDEPVETYRSPGAIADVLREDDDADR